MKIAALNVDQQDVVVMPFPIFTRHTFDSENRTNIFAKLLIAVFMTA